MHFKSPMQDLSSGYVIIYRAFEEGGHRTANNREPSKMTLTKGKGHFPDVRPWNIPLILPSIEC